MAACFTNQERCSFTSPGPKSLTFAEVAAIMQEVSKNTTPTALLHLGVSVVRDEAAPLIITLIGHTGAAGKAEPVAPAPAMEPVRANPSALFSDETMAATAPSGQTGAVPTKAAAPKVKQEDLPLEPIAKGRFDKVEPTIVEGEDLDVPTFLRRKIKK
jgi:cell division protein FtsZ